MLPVLQAEALILDLVSSLSNRSSNQDTEVVDLLSASGRILAAAVTSKLDFPHWDNSAMDGYAVRFADVRSCSAEQPVTLEIVEEIPAGSQPQQTVQPGQAARILTGAMMPAGADTVVMQERTQRQGDRVTILEAPEFQMFVRHRGAFYQAGTPLLQPGIQLNAPEIAVLAAAQCPQVSVYRRVRVAILSTGDELVAPDQPLQPGQIVDSNQYALAALVKQMGAEPVLLGVVPDEPAALKQAIAQAIATADVVLSSGGVSVGDYDYVDEILAALGAEIHIRAVAVKPGKPLTVATFASNKAPQAHSVLYFGLPGNPVSALV
ncbi:MAG TPA: gephyrin-like molybdotransferase Glp, partial [Candidatus Obscuribacterales bacterium]